MKYLICFLFAFLLTSCGSISHQSKPPIVSGASLSDDVNNLLSYHLSQPVKPTTTQQVNVSNPSPTTATVVATSVQSATQTAKPSNTTVSEKPENNAVVPITAPLNNTDMPTDRDIVQLLIDNERWVWLLWTCVIIYASKIYFKKTGKTSEALNDMQTVLTEHMGISQKLIAWFFRKFVWARKIKDKMFKSKSSK